MSHFLFCFPCPNNFKNENWIFISFESFVGLVFWDDNEFTEKRLIYVTFTGQCTVAETCNKYLIFNNSQGQKFKHFKRFKDIRNNFFHFLLEKVNEKSHNSDRITGKNSLSL